MESRPKENDQRSRRLLLNSVLRAFNDVELLAEDPLTESRDYLCYFICALSIVSILEVISGKATSPSRGDTPEMMPGMNRTAEIGFQSFREWP